MTHTYTPTSEHLYCIDGTDGTGKASQTKRLFQRLVDEGVQTKIFSFPRYSTEPGGLIKKLLVEGTMPKDPYHASLYYAVDRYNALPRILGALSDGSHVVLDRYVASNMGHQGSRIIDPARRSDFFRWVLDTEFGNHGLIIPRKTLILDLPPEVALKRMLASGKELDVVERDGEHQWLSHLAYQEVALVMPGACLIACMDGDRELTEDEVHERIWEEIHKE